ncbi:hypothetical protein QBC36DRAFT_181507 [Triangularia setosa]|uniref:Alpha-ketoglutarate-dependent dioxygenase AlkB-like domain-containing protein n=1 Tax=Triangularia setosa TaxID=2587417 RepID=A0AAN6WBF6_9PEZI|nr:hypothetical protein QBC36DRAFT_181507 [Podospora setosa]
MLPLGKHKITPESQESLENIAGPITSPVLSACGRPKRQAAVRAAEKLTSIIDEFGTHDEQIQPRASKRSREEFPEFEDSNTGAEEAVLKRVHTQELSEHQLSDDDGAETDIDADFEYDNVSSYTADTEFEVQPTNSYHPQPNTENPPVDVDSPDFHVTNILASLRAITTHQAYINDPGVRLLITNQAVTYLPLTDQPLVSQPLIDQPWFNPPWFNPPIPIINLPANPFVASPPVVSPPVVNSAAIDYIAAQAFNTDINLPLTVAADKDEASAPIARLAPRGPPPIHSKFRGGICEALPYFKAYKSSCYNTQLVAKGFLIDQEIERGDVFGENVVISTAGGNRVREGTAMVRARDASDNATNVRALKNAYMGGSLIAIIAGEEHPLYPCQPPAAYSVLDWFHITYMWKEKLRTRGSHQFFTVWRIRFEKANLLAPSWWIPIGHEENITPVTCPVRVCIACLQESKEIFTIGWFCLNHDCANYYQISRGQEVDIDSLRYSEAFLNERHPYNGQLPSLMPEIPGIDSNQYGTELHLRGGFVCPRCHHACRRLLWNWLQCEIPGCEFKQAASMSPYPQTELNDEVEAFSKKMESRRRKHRIHDPLVTIWNEAYAVRSSMTNLRGYTVRQFFLTDSTEKIIGSFTIFRSNEHINARVDGPDELFRTLEVEDIGLRRNPAAVVGRKFYSCHTDFLLDKLEGLTRHFQQNFGARYKFGVSVQSKGFADAPPTILKALKRLDWAKSAAVSSATANLPLAEHGLGDDSLTDLAAHNQSFNELLALGYMEEDRINYHDDGEKELGPVVAALSLGSPCTMRFRPKRNRGFETSGTKRGGGRDNHKDILEVEMKHGDMMHAVTPEGKRRFALTARFVDPEKMELQSDKDDATVKGAIPPHAADFAYDGF